MSRSVDAVRRLSAPARRCLIAILLLPLVLRTSPVQAAGNEAMLAQSFPAPPILASAGLVMDASTGQILTAKNPHLRRPMASTTKIMTALLALQLGHLADRIVVPASAFNFESDATVMGLKPGEVVTLKDLLYGLMLPSGADAADTIAIHYGGSESHFVALMNAEAQRLGMHDTHYATPHGLTAPNQYTSVYDLALLARYVSSIPAFMQVVSTRTYSWNGHTLVNVNHPLFWYPGLDGIKPGFTYEAGLCQVLDAHRDGRHIIVALLNTPNLDTDARNLLDFGLRDFSWVTSWIPGDNPSVATVAGKDASGTPYLYYTATGHYVRGAFLSALVKIGGSPVMGFPRTEQLWEGHERVQYFQNGALAFDTRTGRITRLTATQILPTVPTRAVPATPEPTATPRPTPVPSPTEGATSSTKTPGSRRIHGTPVPTVTIPTPIPTVPAPRPSPRPTSRPTPQPPSSVRVPAARAIAAFIKLHPSILGRGTGPMRYIHGMAVQSFVYGAVVYAPGSKTLALLPVGDRVLAARDFLPPHPGNTYPPDFASPAVQRVIGWMAKGTSLTG